MCECGGGGDRSVAARRYEVIPLRVKLVTLHVERLELGVGDADFGRVGSFVEAGGGLQAGAVFRSGDEVHDRLQLDERLAAPVHRDEAEQAVLDLIPL